MKYLNKNTGIVYCYLFYSHISCFSFKYKLLFRNMYNNTFIGDSIIFIPSPYIYITLACWFYVIVLAYMRYNMNNTYASNISITSAILNNLISLS